MKPFQLQRHSRMLADNERLSAYREALRQSGEIGTVVDLGAGTGILSALALEAGASQVIVIEYFQELAKFASLNLTRFGEKAQVLNARSYDIQLDVIPTTLLTETIGLLGPEENIVELTYDFAKRHPSFRIIIPNRLRVCARWIYSELISKHIDSLLAPIIAFCGNSLSNQTSLTYLTEQASEELLTLDHSNSKLTPLSEVIALVEYQLGHDVQSAFSKTIAIPKQAEKIPNALHLYFEAILSKNVILSTSYEMPVTHWLHTFAWIDPNGKANRIKIEFSQGSGEIEFQWE